MSRIGGNKDKIPIVFHIYLLQLSLSLSDKRGEVSVSKRAEQLYLALNVTAQWYASGSD